MIAVYTVTGFVGHKLGTALMLAASSADEAIQIAIEVLAKHEVVADPSNLVAKMD